MIRFAYAGPSAVAALTLLLFAAPANAQSISQLLPARGPTSGNFSLTISGSGLQTATGVLVGGANCPLVGSATATQVVCTVPAGQGLTVPVAINAGASTIATSAFSYDPPHLSALSPTAIP